MSILLLEREASLRPADELLAHQVVDKLCAAYPGWVWSVAFPPGQNIAVIRNMDLMPRMPWGYVLHKTDLYSDPSLRSVIRAGGEILERYRQSREMCRVDTIDPVRQIFTAPEI